MSSPRTFAVSDIYQCVRTPMATLVGIFTGLDFRCWIGLSIPEFFPRMINEDTGEEEMDG